MVRKQVYIEPEQDERLERRARALGVTESALIRQGIDLVTEGPALAADDEAEWHAELDFMRERGRIEVPPGARSWTREELHDERPKYLSR